MNLRVFQTSMNTAAPTEILNSSARLWKSR